MRLMTRRAVCVRPYRSATAPVLIDHTSPVARGIRVVGPRR